MALFLCAKVIVSMYFIYFTFVVTRSIIINVKSIKEIIMNIIKVKTMKTAIKMAQHITTKENKPVKVVEHIYKSDLDFNGVIIYVFPL